VLFVRRDGHALIASGAGLQQALIAPTTVDPPGGKIHRLADGKTPSGLLVDAAMDAVTALLPRASMAEIAREAAVKMRQLAAVGVTCVHEAYVEPELWAALQGLGQRDDLPLRVRALLGPSWHSLPDDPPSPLLRATGFKLLADGALGSRGALLGERYADADTRGLAVCSDDHLEQRATLAAELGAQLAVHAIGDAAVCRALRLFESRDEVSRAGRWRIEHAQIVAPDDLPRLVGRCVATQPIHFVSDAGWAPDRLGAERLPWAYRAASLLRAGAVVGFGSDFPIEDGSPLAGVAAVTNASAHAPWSRADEQLSSYDALDGYWQRAAHLAFDEHLLGRLLPGYFADFVCLARDPFAAGGLVDNRVVATYVGGQCVFSSRSRSATAS
jgi:predicted amidohydrolase YtcJ